MKTFWKYFLITLLLLIGLFCVGVLYLFFFPNSSLFGLTYVRGQEPIDSNTYSTENITKVVLNSTNFDVNVVEVSGDKISLKAFSNAYGFGLTKNSHLSLEKKVNKGVLTFTVTEPSGFLAKASSYIELRLPSGNLDVELNNKNAKTKIELNTNTIQNLSYTASNGKCELSSGTVLGNITAVLNNSTMTAKTGFVANNVNLELGKGKFDASGVELAQVKVTQNERGMLTLNNCQTLQWDFENAGGSITAKKIGNCNITSADTNVTVDEVDTARITLTKSGRVSIKKINEGARSFITTADGNINISEAQSSLLLESKNGNITVNNASKYIQATNERGSITITFGEDVPDYKIPTLEGDDANFNLYRGVKITQKYGRATINGAQNIKADILDSGALYATMLKVIGTNTINSGKGGVSVIVDNDAFFTLTTKADEGGYVNVNLPQISESGGYETNEETTTQVNKTGNETEFDKNTFTITATTGEVRFRSEDLTQF